MNAPSGKDNIFQLNGTEYERMTSAGVHSFSGATKPRKAAFFKANALEVDGTNCTAHTAVTINSGPKESLFKCTDNNASIFFGSLSMLGTGWDAGAIRVTLHILHTTTETITWAADASAQCHAAGETIDSSWSSGVAVDVAITTANRIPRTTSTDITPAGTCAVGDNLFFRVVVDAANFSTNAANSWVYGVTLTYLTSTRNADNE